MTLRCPDCCRIWSRSDLRGKTPQQFAAVIAAKLAALGVPSAAAAESPARGTGWCGRRGRYG